MLMRLRFVGYPLLLILGVSELGATLNFTGLSGADLTEASALDTKYTNMAGSFSHYYGQAMSFAANLSAPIARDNLGKFPSLYVGIGLGASFGNVTGLKNEVDPSIQSNVPSYLPAPNISFNFGMGINRSWDIRFSFFPNVPIALGSNSFGGGTSGSIQFGTYRARVGYHVLEGGFLKPGFTIAGFTSYTTGGLSLTQTGQSVTSGNSSLANMTSTISTSWQYLGFGPEARFWYDLKFFHPFVGYSLGLQVGQFTTGLNMSGDLTVNSTNYGTGSIVISERKAANILTHRLMFGFEISLLVLDIGVEAQVDLTTGLVGVAAATALRF